MEINLLKLCHKYYFIKYILFISSACPITHYFLSCLAFSRILSFELSGWIWRSFRTFILKFSTTSSSAIDVLCQQQQLKSPYRLIFSPRTSAWSICHKLSETPLKLERHCIRGLFPGWKHHSYIFRSFSLSFARPSNAP